MNKFEQFAWWWNKNIFNWIDNNFKPIHALIVLILMFTFLLLGAISLVFWLIFGIIASPFLLGCFYTSLFYERCDFENRLKNSEREEKINSIFDEEV